MFLSFLRSCRFVGKFYGYEPRAVTPLNLLRWLRQFPREDRVSALRVLDKVVYFNKNRIVTALLDHNAAIQRALLDRGLGPDHIAYVHIDTPGSSSSIMMNLLRNKGNLQRLPSLILDANDPQKLIDFIQRKKNVAVVYVDDFLGTGKQFCKARDFLADFFPTAQPELLLAPCICEEAFKELAKRDVEVFTSLIHAKADRPLHPNSRSLEPASKTRLLNMNKRIGKQPSGFGALAASVAMFHNVPNNMPLLLRGSIDQSPFVGILPRTTDLPLPRKYGQ